MKSTGSMVSSQAGNFDTSKGDLRFAQVYVDNKYFPDYKKVPVLLNSTEEFANPGIFRDFICSQQIKFYESELDKFNSRSSNFTFLF